MKSPNEYPFITSASIARDKVFLRILDTFSTRAIFRSSAIVRFESFLVRSKDVTILSIAKFGSNDCSYRILSASNVSVSQDSARFLSSVGRVSSASSLARSDETCVFSISRIF